LGDESIFVRLALLVRTVGHAVVVSKAQGGASLAHETTIKTKSPGRACNQGREPTHWMA
jgi:hypothetical protein